MPHARAMLTERNETLHQTGFDDLRRIADRIGMVAEDIVAFDLRSTRRPRNMRDPSPHNIPARRPAHCMASSVVTTAVPANPDGTYSREPYPVDPTPLPAAKPLPDTAELRGPLAETPDGLTGMAAVLAIEAAMVQPYDA